MAIRKNPWRYAAVFALKAFAILAFLPIWTAWYIGEWEATGDRASFWMMLFALPHAVMQLSTRELLFEYHTSNIIQFSIVVAILLGIGRWRANYRSALE